MLTILHPQERGAIEAQLQSNFAEQLLQLVAAHPGYQEHQLYAWMTTWLGASGEARQHIKGWVALSLDWYQNHGHVQREAGGRYTCLPAYVLGGTPELGGRALLCGHPAAEHVLSSFGVAISRHLVSDTLANSTRQVIGLQRELKLSIQQRNEVDSHGIRCFAAQQLIAALPDVRLLDDPEPHEAVPLPVGTGVWQVFESAYADREPWQSTPREPSAGQLARWLPSNDWQGYRDARYFLCVWDRYGVPLSYTNVALWQLRLAANAGSPRTLYWEAAKRTLWLPLGLPAMLWQWLNLATLSQAERVGMFYTLYLGADDVTPIREITQTRFQLHWTNGDPRQV